MYSASNVACSFCRQAGWRRSLRALLRRLKMREVIVNPEAKSAHNRSLNEEIGKTLSQGVRIYRTWVHDSENRTQNQDYEYEFLTPSKEIHLWIGSLTSEGQLHLARLLDEETSALARTQTSFDSLDLLLFYGGKDRAWYVTCSEHTNLKKKFVFASAH
jgi:hypothetical protein